MVAYEQQSETDQYLTFRVADEHYAIGVLGAKEILRYEDVTRVPATPPSIRGVINVRGNVVPVIDLAAKFGQPANPVTKWTCVVIVEIILDERPTVMGVVADAVSQVIHLAPEEIKPPPSFGTAVAAEYLLGMGLLQKHIVLILDIDKVVTTDDIRSGGDASRELSDEEAPQPVVPLEPDPDPDAAAASP